MSRDYKSRKSSRSAPEKSGSAFLGGFVGYALGLASAIGIWVYFNFAPSPFLSTEKVASSSEKNQKHAAAEIPATPEKPPKEEPAIIVEEKPRFDFYKILPGIDEPEIDHEYRQTVQPPAPQPPVAAKTPDGNNKPVEAAPPPAPPRPAVIPVQPAPQIAAIQPRSIPAEPAPQPIAPQPAAPQPAPPQAATSQSIAPQPAAPKVTAPPPVKEKLFLQAGSFRKNDEAENMKARLALLGVFASIQPIDLAEKGTWYRVRIGPFNNKADVDQTSISLRENGIDTQFVRVQ